MSAIARRIGLQHPRFLPTIQFADSALISHFAAIEPARAGT